MRAWVLTGLIRYSFPEPRAKIVVPPLILNSGFNGVQTTIPTFPWFTQTRTPSLSPSTSSGWIGTGRNSQKGPGVLKRQEVTGSSYIC